MCIETEVPVKDRGWRLNPILNRWSAALFFTNEKALSQEMLEEFHDRRMIRLIERDKNILNRDDPISRRPNTLDHRLSELARDAYGRVAARQNRSIAAMSEVE